MNDQTKGLHLYVRKKGYTHHGIGTGDGMVIHYSGFSEAFNKGPICCVTKQEFSGGKRIHVKKHSARRFTIDESVERAQQRLGEDGYSLWGNNCEHFVEWCIEGSHDSRQIDIGVVAAGGVLIPKGTGSVGKIIVKQVGKVKNYSGPGIMSGLSRIGNTVGKGAIGGIAITSGLSGAASAVTLNNTVLKDSENLPQKERSARKAGRAASYAGAAASTVGSVAVVSAAGTVSGLSAAGITSGLAAIGGTVGGGMLAGTVIVASAPAAITAFLGYSSYKVFKWLLGGLPPESN